MRETTNERLRPPEAVGFPEVSRRGLIVGMALCAPTGLVGQATLGSCPPSQPGSGLVELVGTVLDEESRVPLPRAIVRLEYESEAGQIELEDVTATSDDNGRYQFCELPASRSAKVRASYLLRRSDEEKVDLEDREELELEVDLGNPAFIVFTVADAETGEPVQGASIVFSPIPVGGVTNELGRSSFRAIPPGDYQMTVHHIAYADRTEALELGEEQIAEMRIELHTEAFALEPIEVEVTRRDAYLLDNGFYERRLAMEDHGYFGTWEEIRSYNMVRTLFESQRDLSIRFHRNQVILINGLPMRRAVVRDMVELNSLPFRRIRGVEAYSCSDAPPALARHIGIESDTTNCSLIAIWVR